MLKWNIDPDADQRPKKTWFPLSAQGSTQWRTQDFNSVGAVAPGRSLRGSGQRPEIFFGQSLTSTFTVVQFANCFSIERERNCSEAVAYAGFQSQFTIINLKFQLY